MFRYTLLILVALSTASPAWANTWAEGMFEEFSWDFGAVPRGQVVVHHFRVVNNTKSTVHISSVSVSCICTSVQALQYTLAPGQETAIVARMNSGAPNFYGLRTVQIYVNFDQPRREEVRLSVQANSRSELQYFPDTLTFGRVKKGTTPTTQITVTFYGVPQVQVTDVKCDSNYIQPKVQELRRETDVFYLVTATPRADIPEGKWFTDVWLTTNLATMPRLRVPLTVEVEAPATPPATPPASRPATPPATRPATPPATPPAGSGQPPAGAPAQPPPTSAPAKPQPATAPPVQPPQAPTPPTPPPATTPQPQLAPPPQQAPQAAPRSTASIVVLAPMKVGMETSRKVTLSGTQPFRITNVNITGSPDPELIVQPVSNGSQTVHELTLTFRPSQAGQVNRLIRVTTDMTNNRDIEFNAQTQILPP